MNTYSLLKTIHIVSSVVLVGTGFGSAFYLFFVNRSGSLPAQAVVCRLVVWLQWKKARMAAIAVAEGAPPDPLYQRHARLWEMLGYPAFTAMLVVFYLMVNKPLLWSAGEF